MATQEIDKLALDLEVTGLDATSVDNIVKLSDALEKLQKTLQNNNFGALKELGIKVNTKSFAKQLSNIQKNAEEVGKKIQTSLSKATSSIYKEYNGIVPKPRQSQASDAIDVVDEKATQNLVNFQYELKQIDKNLNEVTKSAKDSAKAIQDIYTDTNIRGLRSWEAEQNEIKKSAEESAAVFCQESFEKKSGLTQTAKEIKKLNPVIEGLGEKAKKVSSKSGGLGKFMSALKRVALYRFIRAIIKGISQSLQEGIKNVALFDKSANKTMSQFSTSITNIKNGLGLMLQPFLEAITPAVQQLSMVFVEIGNAISKANAQMKGLSSYTKISAKYMKDYKKSVQNASTFSFDTFNVLSNSNDTSSMFETEQIEETNEGLNDTQNFLLSIKTLVADLWKFTQTIGGFIMKLVADLMPALTEIINIVNQIFEAINPILESLITTLQPLFDVILVDLLPELLNIVSVILEPILQVIMAIMDVVMPIVDAVVKKLSPIIKIISEYINAMWSSLKPIFELVGNIVSQFIKMNVGLGNGLSSLSGFLDMLDGILDIARGFIKIVQAITALISGDASKAWDLFKEAGISAWNGIKKIGASIAEALVNGLLSGINWITKKINSITSGLSKVWSWAGIPEIPAIPEITWKLDIGSFATGGELTGELWQMNEYGKPEMLFNSRNTGNTSVINQAQLGEAFMQAILNSGLIEAIRESGNLYLDGKEVAQSKSFKREINRTNPQLNIR
jgi:phage-related protein